MDEESPKKLRKWHWFIIAGIAVVFVVLKIIDITYWPKETLILGGRPIKVIMAERPTHWYKGLSGRDSLGNYQGMYFKYNEDSRHTMVMRDMNFPIDFVWIDNGLIVDMAPNAMPEPGKTEAELTRYTPRLACDAVLELIAGYIQSNGLKIGDKAELLSE